MFSIVSGEDATAQGGNGAQRREYDKKLGAGTMSRSGATCVCCRLPSMTMEDIRLEGRAGRLGITMTAVITDGPQGKDYRLPSKEECQLAGEAENAIAAVFADFPFGVPEERTPKPAGSKYNSSATTLYGLYRWRDLFTDRQVLALGSFANHTRATEEALASGGFSKHWVEAILASLYCGLSRLADRNSALCTWQIGAEKIGHTFARFALPITWDFVEVMPWADASGGYGQAIDWVAQVAERNCQALSNSSPATISCESAMATVSRADVVVTDPPYYDAIPYSD